KLTARPIQSPYPPIRIAANRPDTFPFAGRRGMPIFATPLINPPDKLKEGMSVYRDALPSGARGDTALACTVHAAGSRAEDRAQAEPSLMRFLHEAVERLRPLRDADVKRFEAFRQVVARMERVTFADFDREMVVFGEPDYCIERV